VGHPSTSERRVKPIISQNSRIRHPHCFVVKDDSVVDDFCYFSTKVTIGRCSHIASGCSVAGGLDRQFTLGDYSSLSSGVRIWCVSDDFVNDIVTILPHDIGPVKTHLIIGDVSLADYTAVGSNSVIMPDNRIPTGTVIGALSFVPPNFQFEAWSVYVGNPIRLLRSRNRDNVLEQAARLDKFCHREQEERE
jgi:acetyltransferase-like isoleucine patch superfamily enzyme